MVKKMNELVSLGKITKNQGNKGELRLMPYIDNLKRFELLKEVFLVSPEQSTTIKKEVKKIWFHKNFVIIHLSGIDNIGDALKYRNYEVKIKKDEILDLADDQYYVDQLLDLTVFLLNHQMLGKIIDVIDTKGTDILLIQGRKKEYMIPMSKEYIKKIDLENKEILIEPVKGILDL